MPSEKPEPLTQAQKDQLDAELAELEGPRRAAMVEAIATARAFGDLSENFEYHAAKNEQGLLERRITMLRDRLSRAVIVDDDGVGDGSVRGGSQVEPADERRRRRKGRGGGRAGRSDGGRDLWCRGRLAGLAGRARADGREGRRRGRDRGAEGRLARPRDLGRTLTTEPVAGARRVCVRLPACC